MPIQLIAEIVPKNNGQFALLDDSYLRGSFHIVDNLTTRNAIPTDIRKQGMRVYVQSTDTLYILQPDLISWIIDKSTTVALQDAYNKGMEIITETGNPVVLTGSDLISYIFTIRNSQSDILKVNANNTIEFLGTLKGKDYTSNINSSVITNSTNIVVDLTDKTIYRAIQYFYTVENSDNTGYETGQLYLIHDNISATIYSIMGNSTGIPCGLTFSTQIIGYNLSLLATTDNSTLASRNIHLFKVALT